MPQWDESWDFVVIGSGGGGMAAGLTMRAAGQSVIILEKTDKIGGSTAMSGGVIWIPNHPLQAADGVEDSYDAGLAYMDAVIGDAGPSTSRARKDAFLRGGPRFVDMLIDRGVRLKRAEGWSDYYDEMPGGCPRSRSLIAPNFDVNTLGAWAKTLRRGPNPLPVGSMEVARISLAKKSIKGVIAAMRLGMRMSWARLTGQDLRSMGGALQGRVMQAALEQGVAFRIDAPVTDLIFDKGRVVGVTVASDGAVQRIEARLGVLIAAGGFEHDAEMRRTYQPATPVGPWSVANPGNSGDLIRIAMRHGAATGLMNETVWIPSTMPPGRAQPMFAVNELGKPHIIVVNQAGERFMNEAASYMEVGQHMFRAGSVPAYIILDDRHRSAYPWGMTPPGVTPKPWFDSGYMKTADDLGELARKAGIDPEGLKATVARFNGFARRGVDEDFRRGARAYDRVWADFTHKPNPGLGTIERPPFYCVELIPSDVGTFGGIMTDERARVLHEDGSPIPGLYAAGNCTASVMGRTYPGAGASIAASYVFGMIAAEDAATATACA